MKQGGWLQNAEGGDCLNVLNVLNVSGQNLHRKDSNGCNNGKSHVHKILHPDQKDKSKKLPNLRTI